MAHATVKTLRQSAIFGVEDWKRLYQTYREANFQSYDFETLRKIFIDYIRLYYPETFNDYVESSEFIALLDVIAFMGQSLAFRTDLNTRENYLDTAERRDSVERLANLVGYTPKRNQASQGFLKVNSVKTTENVQEVNGPSLANVTVNWADPTNLNWQEQFSLILNAAMLDTQRIGVPGNRATILGTRTDEYGINLVPGFLPVLSYTATVDGISMPFEAVNSTSVGQDFIYEPTPQASSQFNILFRNDQLGFNSPNTGFFFLFKQGTLQNFDFNLSEKISNQTVDVDIEGINNQDYWLYQLDSQGAIQSEWGAVQSTYTAAQTDTARKVFSLSSRTNDQVTINFGDGVFSDIPVGTFRFYVRASNGLTYIINPEDMQSITLEIGYISRSGRSETLSFVCGITEPVTNSRQREVMSEIKQRAPARYYTQNRMVNGEDYNNFPFTEFNGILKSKALNRASIGTSRYLDLLDATNKYSSTNVFGSDGALYKNNSLATTSFTWTTLNDISNVILNTIEPMLSADTTKQFYYANYVRPNLLVLSETWHQSTTLANETTGYFENSLGAPQPIGVFATNNNKYIAVGSLVKFVPPTGKYFDSNNRIKVGVPTKPNEKLIIWASPTGVVVEGTNQGRGDLTDGTGPVTLNNFVPTGAICSSVIPVFKTIFPTALKQSILEQIQLFRNFGLGYNNTTGTWYLITSTNIDIDAEFNLTTDDSSAGINNDASWVIQCVNDGETFTISTRVLDYFFGSVLETRFLFYGNEQIYDPRTGTVIRDFINVLKTNNQPDSTNSLASDVYMTITGQPTESDGFANDFQVTVSYQDSDNDGIPDNPDFFEELVAPTVNANEKLVFLQRTIDFDNLERFLLIEDDEINSEFATEEDIEAVMLEFDIGQKFYAYDDDVFYTLEESSTGVRSLDDDVDETLIARTGRQGLSFQYRHNSALTNRIDPGSTNIIDVYLVTQEYYTAYQNYIRDVTGTITEPARPTIDQLNVAYQGLQAFKMISDNMILNAVTFKPLFGAKAVAELQATIKVIRAPNSTASTSEIKNQVVATMNEYFTLDKWDFGDRFYFSELSAFIHSRIGSLISSVVLVPLNVEKSFGDLYEIRSAPNEIFVNAATVNSVEVISGLTSTNLRSVNGSSTRTAPAGYHYMSDGTLMADSAMPGYGGSSSSGGSSSGGGGGSY